MRNLRRFLSILPCLLFLGGMQAAFAQVYLNYSANQPALLTANAGADQLICPGDPADLGGTPAANGGYGGYAYSWIPTLNVANPTAANTTTTPTQNTDYILMLTDSLGCTAYDTLSIAIDTCVGIGAVVGVNAFEVYPNPNEGKFTVKVNLGHEFEALTLDVIDLNGRIVFTKEYLQPGSNLQEQITLNGLSRGAYFIRLEGEGMQLSRKMIIR